MSSSVRSLTLLITIGAVAIALNPTEQSFKEYLELQLARNGASWIERKVISKVSSLIYQKQDYKFFTLIYVPEIGLRYLGLFGMWLGLPNSLDQLRQSLNFNR